MKRPMLLCLGLVLLPQVARAEVDAIESRLLARLHALLAWKNVDGRPILISGPALRRTGAGLHTVRLQAGRELALELPSGAMLRLRRATGGISPGDVIGFRSNGSGLLAEFNWQTSVDGRDLLWRPVTVGPVTIRLERRAGAAPIDLAIFVSQQTYPEGLVPYRNSLPLGTTRATVGGARADEVRYGRLDGPVSLHVTGPKRIAVSTRLIYGLLDEDRQQSYRIEALLDGHFWRALEFETMPVTREALTLDGRGALLGRERTDWLEIPAGARRLTLRPSRPLLARAAAYDDNAWLFPALNAPRGLDQATGDPKAPTFWAVPPAAAAQDLDPALLEQATRRVARGNDARAGGLAAAARLTEVARTRPANRAIDRAAIALRGSHTFFRDVSPVAVTDGEQRQVMLPTPDGQRGAEGFTLPVPAAPAVFTYPLPPLEAPSELRLFAERAGLAAPAELLVQIGDGPARRLRVLPEHASQPLAILTLPLPAHARAVRLWRAPGSPAVRAGAQYRAARPPRLSDAAYRAELDLLGLASARALFTAGLRDALGCERWLADSTACPAWRRADSIAATELLNDWVPLYRLLRSRHRSLFEDLTPIAVAPQRIAALRAAGETGLADRLLRARALTLRGSERSAAFGELARQYARAGDLDAQLAVHAADLIDAGGVEAWRALAVLLRADGQQNYARQVELLAGVSPAGEPGEPAEALVVEHGGAAAIVARERALSFLAWIAQPNRPVKLAVPPGLHVKLELRPLIGSAPQANQVRVSSGSQMETLSLLGARASAGLDLIGLPVRVGTATEAIVPTHSNGGISIVPTGGPVLVTFSVARGSVAVLADRIRLNALLAAFDQDPESPAGRAALVEAAALAARVPEDAAAQALWRKFERRSRWRRLTGVDLSAGVRSVNAAGQPIESPALRARAALLAPLGPGERFLPSSGGLAVFFGNARANTITARLSLDNLPSYGTVPAAVLYRINDGPVRRAELAPHDALELSLAVPAGDHVVRFALAEPVENGFVRLRLSEPGAVIGGTGDRAYDVATASSPFVLSVAGPTWLRVDELRDGRTISSFRPVGPGVERLTFRPAAGRREGLFRLFALTPDAAELAISNTSPVEPSPGVPPQPLRVSDAPSASQVRFVDVLPLGRQEDGTTSIGLALQRRYPSTEEGEDGGRSERVDHFLEGRLVHRRFYEAARLYTRVELLGRVRTEGGPTLGTRAQLGKRLDGSPFAFTVGGSAFAQLVDGNRLEWSAYVEADIAWRQAIGPQTSQTFEIGAFARHLSLGPYEAARMRDLDLDIFNRYRSDHRKGLTATWRLSHSPWLDTRWRLQAAAVSNNNLSLDRASLNAEWEQLLGSVVVRAGWARTRFFADADRSQGRWDDTLRLGADWDRFQIRGRRLEIGARATYQIDRRDLAATVALTLHFGPARGYSDFMPGEVDFETLRARRLFSLPTNGLFDVSQD
ncbi:MAG: hypothetical protein V4579_13490 [Pseudomonadota bacterium]